MQGIPSHCGQRALISILFDGTADRLTTCIPDLLLRTRRSINSNRIRSNKCRGLHNPVTNKTANTAHKSTSPQDRRPEEESNVPKTTRTQMSLRASIFRMAKRTRPYIRHQTVISEVMSGSAPRTGTTKPCAVVAEDGHIQVASPLASPSNRHHASEEQKRSVPQRDSMAIPNHTSSRRSASIRIQGHHPMHGPKNRQANSHKVKPITVPPTGATVSRHHEIHTEPD